MTDLATIQRVHQQAIQDYRDENAIKGIVSGLVLAAGFWGGLYLFIKAWVWVAR